MLTIIATSHLPAAVDESDISLALTDVRRLVRLRSECRAWRIEMIEYRAALRTPAARVLYKALCMRDVAAVEKAERRISDELASRITGSRTAAA